jgi:hypothetical protein
MFTEPVDPERDGAPGYFDIVKRPMDLTTVRQRLQNNEYLTVFDWKEDVLLTFSNAMRYNRKGSPIFRMAAELQNLFRDLIQPVVDDDSTTWRNELSQFHKDLLEHVKTQTEGMNGYNALSQKQFSNAAESVGKVRKFAVNSMTIRELEKLAENLELLNKKEQKERIVRILQKGNPEIGFRKGGIIDLNLLTPQTLSELKEFVTQELEENSQICQFTIGKIFRDSNNRNE